MSSRTRMGVPVNIREVSFELIAERNPVSAYIYVCRLETTKSGLLVNRSSHNADDHTTMCAVHIEPIGTNLGGRTDFGLIIPSTEDLRIYSEQDTEHVIELSDSKNCAQNFQRLVDQSINGLSGHKFGIQGYLNEGYRPFGNELTELKAALRLIVQRYSGEVAEGADLLTERASSASSSEERFPGNYM